MHDGSQHDPPHEPEGNLDGTIIRLIGVTKVYHREAIEVPVLERLDLDVPRGEFLAFLDDHADQHAIWIDPANPQRVYLGMEGAVYYSGNGGDSWIRVANNLSAEDDVIRIAIDPLDPRNIYAAAGWSDGFRLLSWDPAAVDMVGIEEEE